LRTNSGSSHKHTKYIIIGFIVWSITAVTGLLCYQSAHIKASQTHPEVIGARIEAGVSAIRSLALQNRFPVYTYFTFKDKNRCKFKLDPKIALKGDIIKLVAILDVNNKTVACTDIQFVDKRFPSLKRKRNINPRGDVSIEQGILAGKKEIIGFLLKIRLPETHFDQAGAIYLALAAPQKDKNRSASSLQPYKTLLILWFAGGFSVFGIVLILFINKKKAPGFHPHPKSLREDESLDACIKPYQIKRLIATGGMAHVYLGVNARDDADLQIEVVIKKILPSRIDDAHNFTRLFHREAQTAAKLGGHPNIVQIYDYFSKHHVIVMQYIKGQDLQTICKKQNQGIPIDLTLFIISEIVKGLDYAHTKTDRLTGLPLNIIHRDIKPGNILISYNGQVKIADFGIAKAVGVQDATILMPTGEDTTLLSLALKGTPAYMSPEQAAQETVDHRSDIFSLGLIFHEMLTGSKVRESMHGFSSAKIIKVIDKERIELVSEFVPDVSPMLNAMVMKCLEKYKKLRYQSTRELHNDMKRLKRKMNITYSSSELASFMRRNR